MKQGGDDNYTNINKNQIGPSAKVTLKSKIKSLEDAIKQVSDDLEGNIDDIKVLQQEKDDHQKFLKTKTEEMKASLLEELASVEEEMKKHLVVQKEENNRLQKLITALKGEKTVLLNKLIALQRRLSDMEEQVGHDNLKFI
jgi:predicted  nucleic acid-binding Zn-ribbon protein